MGNAQVKNDESISRNEKVAVDEGNPTAWGFLKTSAAYLGVDWCHATPLAVTPAAAYGRGLPRQEYALIDKPYAACT